MDLKLSISGMRPEEAKALADPKNELLMQMIVADPEMNAVKSELKKQMEEVRKLAGKNNLIKSMCSIKPSTEN